MYFMCPVSTDILAILELVCYVRCQAQGMNVLPIAFRAQVCVLFLPRQVALIRASESVTLEFSFHARANHT